LLVAVWPVQALAPIGLADLQMISTQRKAKATLPTGGGHLKIDDIANIKLEDLSGHVDLAWASFPCQDLSLAGSRAGLKGERSGTFWPFWQHNLNCLTVNCEATKGALIS
jgi:site-specific DNA-cytosine methylase